MTSVCAPPQPTFANVLWKVTHTHTHTGLLSFSRGEPGTEEPAWVNWEEEGGEGREEERAGSLFSVLVRYDQSKA